MRDPAKVWNILIREMKGIIAAARPNAARFIPHPTPSKPASRLSGDAKTEMKETEWAKSVAEKFGSPIRVMVD